MKNSSDLCTILKKPEYRVLWMKEGVDLLPKEVALELIRTAYVNNSFDYSNGSNGGSGNNRL